MKYSGHESFSIRKNWLQKGIRKIGAFKKGDLEAMDELGLGRNMVKSLRYWLKVSGLSTDEKKVFGLSPFGQIVAKHDPFIQETGTLCLLHYNLASNKENATSWYFLFNEFNMTEFSSEDFCRAIEKWDEMNNESAKKTAYSSFQKDFDCIRRTYISRLSCDEDPESNMASPLSELGLLSESTKDEVKKTAPLKNNIPPLILLSLILKMRENEILKRSANGNESSRVQNDGFAEIKLSSLLNEKCSPGKIFNMNSILLMNLLSSLENQNYLQIVRTAGLDVVRIKTEMTFEDCVRKYYEELENE